MARTLVTVTEVPRAGVAVPAQQATDQANGMSLPYNDGRIMIELEAVGGASKITILIPGKVDSQEVKELTIECAEGVKKVFGPLPTNVYNQGDGTVSINCSDVKGKLRVYKI